MSCVWEAAKELCTEYTGGAVAVGPIGEENFKLEYML
jgi:hypothetical protein